MSFFKEYDANGNLRIKGIQRDGLKQGKWLFYYENGNVHKEIMFSDDVENGSWKMWYPNTNLHIELFMKNGCLDGKWTDYYESGNIRETGVYKDGDYSPLGFWDENGFQTLKDGTGSKIEKFGTVDYDVYKQYYENGIFVKEEKISGSRFGPFEPR